MKGYFSENSPKALRDQLRRSEVLVNGVKNDLVIACDTEVGFAICLLRDPTKEGERWGSFKCDPNGYKGRVATELVWGTVEIRPRAGVEAEEEVEEEVTA